MKTIDFCIPFIGWGLRYTEFLISNLLATATYPDRISISLSAHSQSDIELIKSSWINNVIKRVVVAPAWGNTPSENFFSEGIIGSANHCSAIQSLCEQATADVIMFSDYDMAFLVAGWDQKIVEILDDHGLCGVGYPDYSFPIHYVEFPTLYQQRACNYQELPNLSFLAITQRCLTTFFPKGISTFHQYLAEGGLPFQIVNTPHMANALHLNVGSVWWMDSGFEIPFVIQQYKLRYETFIPLAFDNQCIFAPDIFTDAPASGNLPDVFVDGRSGEPLLAHFGHGTFKSQWLDSALFDNFVVAVDRYLGKH